MSSSFDTSDDEEGDPLVLLSPKRRKSSTKTRKMLAKKDKLLKMGEFPELSKYLEKRRLIGDIPVEEGEQCIVHFDDLRTDKNHPKRVVDDNEDDSNCKIELKCDEKTNDIKLSTFEEHRIRWKQGMDESDEIVRLNVGGRRFTTTRTTLLGCNLYLSKETFMSFFTSLLSGQFTTLKDEAGAYFIDRDPQYFAPILTFLRTGVVTIPSDMPLEAVLREAEFYCITPLVERCATRLRKRSTRHSKTQRDITKGEFFTCLTMARINGFMLSMSGMKMKGLDFSYMQLLNVHFSSCDLEGSNFSNAILNKAQFHGANLKNVTFIHSLFSSHTNPFSRTTNLQGVRFHKTDYALSLYGKHFEEWGYEIQPIAEEEDIVRLVKEKTKKSEDSFVKS